MSISRWEIPGITLVMGGFVTEPEKGTCELVQRRPGHNLLTSLAHLTPEKVAACALDIIFQFGYRCLDTDDAMEAYTEFPLQNPPDEYLRMCHAVDWRAGYTREYMAVVLAGSANKRDRDLFRQVLWGAPEDMRQGPLLAASSFNEPEFMERLAAIAMSINEDGAHCTGEMWALRVSFSRWIHRRQLTVERLDELLGQYESDNPGFFRARRFLNYLRCPDWGWLPYPDEPPPRW